MKHGMLSRTAGGLRTGLFSDQNSDIFRVTFFYHPSLEVTFEPLKGTRKKHPQRSLGRTWWMMWMRKNIFLMSRLPKFSCSHIPYPYAFGSSIKTREEVFEHGDPPHKKHHHFSGLTEGWVKFTKGYMSCASWAQQIPIPEQSTFALLPIIGPSKQKGFESVFRRSLDLQSPSLTWGPKNPSSPHHGIMGGSGKNS